MISLSRVSLIHPGKGPSEALLSQIDLLLGKGEFALLRGPVGAGKTTLLRLVCGMVAPSSGQVEVCGVRLPARRRRLAALRRRMGILEEEPRLLAAWSVSANVALGLEVLGLGGRQLRQRVAAALRSLNLEALAEQPVGKLSAGQRQKVAVARALAGEPLIVLADEPLRHLDAPGAEEVLGLLRWLNLQGSTILVAAGEAWPGAAGRMAAATGRTFRLEGGRLIEEGLTPPREAACAC